ncbi:hypothetical protein [Sulfurimonas sp.]|uniref:hypothetical protein n=1 Tax=Sulfurimonas sp. TaxID=2022749 RepID=UPI002AB0E589|nr:hypothetical protein [Sulfurimonas sp.]
MNEIFLNLIQKNEEHIEHKKFQIILDKKLRDQLFSFATTISADEDKIKDLMRFGVRKALRLKHNDIIIIKKEQIFIKIFNKSKIKKVPKEEENTIANRFNGIEEDELDDFYDEYFSKEESREFFQIIVKEFVERYFIEEKIDNNIYENNVFPLLQNIIIEQLIFEFDDSDEFFKGFSGYIFRIHFTEVFEYIADFILNEIAFSSDYMIDFLKYYSLDIVIVNGEKYRVPSLETKDGLKWNVISMLSIAKIYTRTKKLLKKLDKEIHLLDDKIVDLFINEISPVEYNNQYLKEKQKLDEDLSIERRRLDESLDMLQIVKEENDKVSLTKDIKKIKKDFHIVRRSLELLGQKEVNRSDLDKYVRYERELDYMLREQKAEEKILSQNETSFLLIKKSIVKALISKKQRV